MSNPTSTPPPKAPRGKHRHSRSAAGQIGPMESSYPQNPHRLRQNLNSTYHLSNSSLSQGLTDPSDNEYQSANLTDGPSTPPRTPKPRGAGRTTSDGTAILGASAVSKQRKQRMSARPKDVQISSSPVPPSDSVTPPLVGPSRNAPLTPGKTSSTPSKTAYAGPTFHASPAPSALPLPSFFSKSLPHTGNSLQAMLEEDGSDNSETSSSRDSPTAPAERQLREESPLDIFFRADKEEKAKARQNNVDQGQFDSPGSNVAQIGSPSYLRSPSSPLSIRPGRDSTTPEIFAMDSDSGSNPRKPYGPAFSTPYNERINTIRANTAPPGVMAQSLSDEEQRKAKTQALKDLLFSPQSRRPATLSPQSDELQYYSDGGHASPSPLAPRNSYVQRTSSGPSTPIPFSKAQHSRNSNFHFLHESLLATANGSPSPINRQSNLRQEVVPPKSPERSGVPGFPSHPTPTHSNKLDVSTISRNYISSHINGDFSKPSFSFNRLPQATGTAAGTENIKGSMDLKNMENDLRRILKMDAPPDAGVVGSALPVSVPLPGYVDGVSAPTNGMKNGVLGS
ncbi:hypothetical protein FGG08_002314 [Glutinoglossum americanum]|uniref:Uncharacterized protein n=1 Tax=Glutinoglossum americanum TaxID=1670608 RepID=A0A9P8I4Y1_9PEZI|nr:hypothetical protein FGG08_002314 [Glutinoglossum americanum]